MNNKLFKTLTTYLFLTIMLQIIFEGIVNPDNVFLYTAGTIIIYLLTILAVYYLNHKEIIEMFYDYKKNWKKNLKKNIITWLIGFILMMAFNYLIIIILNNKLPLNEELVRELYLKYLVASIIANLFLAPILEEFVFRLSFNLINNKYLYLFISSLVFSLLHTLGSLDSFESILYILPYFTLGVTFGVIYYRSENIFDSILIHALHNALVLGLYFIF